MKYLFTIFCCFTILKVFAQQPAVKEKAKNYYFYKKDGITEVSTKDSADIVQEVIKPDSGMALYTVREYYKDGSLKFSGLSSNLHPIVLEDTCISYYPNGKKSYKSYYEFGFPVGKTFRYYPNGKSYIIMDISYKANKGKTTFKSVDSVFVEERDSSGKTILENGNGYYKRYDYSFKNILEEGTIKNSQPDGVWQGFYPHYGLHYKEQYDGGKSISGNSVDSSRKSYTYKERFTEAQFPGGSKALGKYLSETVRFPHEAAINGAHGTVVCRFIIGTNGNLSDMKVIKHVEKSLDNQALLVLATMPSWKPATCCGKPIEQTFTIPISFNNKVYNSPLLQYIK